MVQKGFWAVAVFAGVLQVLMLLGSAFAGHDLGHGDVAGHDTGGGHDSHNGNATTAAKVFSFRALLAFLLGFGWAGALLSTRGLAFWLLLPVAAVTGVFFMWLFLATMRLLFCLRSDGNLDYHNAIGHTGSVYVTIPPARGGRGQVEILLQERLITADAVTDHPHSLAPNTKVIVWAVEGESLMVVAPAPAEIAA